MLATLMTATHTFNILCKVRDGKKGAMVLNLSMNKKKKKGPKNYVKKLGLNK